MLKMHPYQSLQYPSNEPYVDSALAGTWFPSELNSCPSWTPQRLTEDGFDAALTAVGPPNFALQLLTSPVVVVAVVVRDHLGFQRDYPA